ncbi:elongation factor P [Planctomycetota bacterium]
MITTSDFKKGMTIKLKGQIHEIIDYQHVKPGKGHAFVRSKLKNLEAGKMIEHTFRASEKVEQVITETKQMQFLYREDGNFILMDLESYDQIPVPEAVMGESVAYMKEGSDVSVKWGEGQILSIKLPTTVDLKVTKCDPGVAGDTVQGGTKPFTVETGATIQAPLFINKNDVLKIDTRTGEYLERST